jgi:hypothetical protein
VTAPTATGSGKGRSARQSWGFTMWPHSHWAELNNIYVLFGLIHFKAGPTFQSSANISKQRHHFIATLTFQSSANI